MANRDPLPAPGPIVRLLTAVLSISLFAVLAYAVLDQAGDGGGLTESVAERVDESGVKHPVTAVLLNFRAYDTWLEVAVLLLAAWGALVLRQATRLPEPAPVARGNPILDWLVRALVPVTLVVGVYLLWLGTDLPGGAFQAGAVIGAAGVFLRIGGYRSIGRLSAPALRASLLTGFTGFLTIATILLIAGWGFLEYPPSQSGFLILLIEVIITWSVAVSVVTFFVAARPGPSQPAPDESSGGSA